MMMKMMMMMMMMIMIQHRYPLGAVSSLRSVAPDPAQGVAGSPLQQSGLTLQDLQCLLKTGNLGLKARFPLREGLSLLHALLLQCAEVLVHGVELGLLALSIRACLGHG